MRSLVSCFALAAVSVFTLSAIAQPPDKDGKKSDDKRAEMREKMLKEFDTNKDGKLSDEERAKAREKMREMRATRGKAKGGARHQGRKTASGAVQPVKTGHSRPTLSNYSRSSTKTTMES